MFPEQTLFGIESIIHKRLPNPTTEHGAVLLSERLACQARDRPAVGIAAIGVSTTDDMTDGEYFPQRFHSLSHAFGIGRETEVCSNTGGS